MVRTSARPGLKMTPEPAAVLGGLPVSDGRRSIGGASTGW